MILTSVGKGLYRSERSGHGYIRPERSKVRASTAPPGMYQVGEEQSESVEGYEKNDTL